MEDVAAADPIASEPGLADWLAAATDADRGTVAEELELAARRRAFVVDELVDAGFSDAAVLDGVMRLTGLSAEDARLLIASRSR
jgi:hypothetical protein